MRFVDVAGKTLHYQRLGVDFRGVPVVFLHEGLGSVELWRDFPTDVTRRAYRPGLVYSRHGNGWSSPLTEPRRPDYMHEEALQVLPRVIEELVGRPPVLVGHSDGASIALIYAGSGHAVEALVLVAPHVFVEPLTVESISAIRAGFVESELPEKMARYHTEPATTFYGWADIWLSPAFAAWDITEYLPGVSCPTLLVQGDRDEYGTIGQLDVIESSTTGVTERLIVPGAGHSPQLSHRDLVVEATVRFIEAST